jgi:cyclic pyranopterin phosphate synthase
MSEPTRDHERVFRTLRISVTSACDLDCAYCDAGGDARGAAGMSLGDIRRIAVAAWEAGVETVRITGGEPLLRSDIADVVCAVAGAPGARTVAMTTNAQRLAGVAADLRACGLARVNIGLPSLRPETYRRMTGGRLQRALDGVSAALAAGLSPVKVNVVLERGVNADGIRDFVEFARRTPVEVRFIERMPFAGGDGMVSARDVRTSILGCIGGGALGERQTATSEVLTPEGFAGSLGTISPVSAPFCGRCDRLRVTAEGRLRACLSEPTEIDLAPALARGASSAEIIELFTRAFAGKPAAHAGSFAGPMRGIGG